MSSYDLGTFELAGQIWKYDPALYSGLEELPCSGWAWEFKRRDPELINAYNSGQSIRPQFHMNNQAIGVFNLQEQCPTAEEFGLHFIPNPNLSAHDIVPFWLPDIMHFNFHASVELLEDHKSKDIAFHWKNIPGEKNILFSPTRRTKLNVNAHAYAAQFTIEENSASVLDTKYLSLKIGEKHLRHDNIVYLSEFSTHCQGQDITHKFRRGFFPETLKQALIALDGVLNKATQREISSALFGSKQTQFDWDNGIFSLKSRTRRLIKKGQSLMTHDYRKLL